MVPDKLSLQQLGPTIGTSMMPQKLIDYLLVDSKQAVDDFSDYPSQGDYYGPDGEIVSAEEDWGAVSNEAIANMMADIAEANAEAAAVSAVNQDIMAALDDMRGGYGGWSGGDDAGMGDYGGSDTGGGGGGGYGI